MKPLPSVTHTSFSIDRLYPHDDPTRVYRAFIDPEARRRWFFHTDTWTLHALDLSGDIVPGAFERSRFSPPNSDSILTNDTTWLEVIEDAWLVFAYVMTIDGGPLSSSLSTVEFRPEGQGTRLVFTEQGVYHDRFAEGREDGTRWMLEELGRELAR